MPNDPLDKPSIGIKILDETTGSFSEDPLILMFDEDLDDDEIGEDDSGGLHNDSEVPDPPVSTIDGHRVLTYVHTNGVHQLPTSFCKCSGAPSEELQLLRMGFFPSTSVTPQTSFTFQLLDDYLLENLECKTSALHYFSKLRRMTSKAFPNLVKVCNEAFSIILMN